MIFSKLISLTPVEEAVDELRSKFRHSPDIMKPIEKLFKKSSKKKVINNDEWQHVDLDKYYTLNLYMPPEEVGYGWIKTAAKAKERNKHDLFHILCKERIGSKNYDAISKINSDHGVLEASLGDIEEQHVKVWMGKMRIKFSFNEKTKGPIRFDFDRIVRDYYETFIIVERCLKEQNCLTKFQILDAFYHRLNAVVVFLLIEVCEAQMKYGGFDSSDEHRKEVYQLSTFIITALLMYKKVTTIVNDNREKERTALGENNPNYVGCDIFAFVFPESTTFYSRPKLITSSTASCSFQEVDNVQVYFS
ncbi:hypothetical protein CRE_24122 [Caenorhabditis remanei]|uniref:Uncharacterized protein n=1 Tax=Caenorhabditis remanei TaxID=31234 RepID=E3MVP3_CAERE|nr:hypothetical protein CRE_24122 [Caenorhabditis remanei]